MLLDDSAQRVSATAFGQACGTGQDSSFSNKGDEADLTSNVLVKAATACCSMPLPVRQYG